MSAVWNSNLNLPRGAPARLRSCLNTQKSTKSAEGARFKETLNAERGTMNLSFIPRSAFKKHARLSCAFPRFSRYFAVFK
jgi:hypothetical protein